MPIHKQHLHELLKEDQEPFHLKNYIADRRSQLNRPPRRKSKSILQLKKRNHVIGTSSKSKSSILSRHACFLSFQDSTVVSKSQFSDFLNSQSKSPSTTRTASVFLHIPSGTSALLLEAAMRIQKQQGYSKPRASSDVGLFSSVLKKLKERKPIRNSEIQGAEVNKSRKSEMKVETCRNQSNVRVDEWSSDDEMRFSCSCNFSRLSSAGWSESNEGRRSLDMGTFSSSWRSENSGGLDFVAQEGENRGLSPSRKRFCSSPLSPFRFSPLRSPSPGRRSPVLSSPAASPCQRKEQRKENVEGNASAKNKTEEKEQCSPVSILDPLFENEDEEDHQEDYDAECSFAFVERAKEQLLHKLRRFEKLANLDPVELEKRMMEQLKVDDQKESVDDEETHEEEQVLGVERSRSPVNPIESKSELLYTKRKVPADMEEMFVSDWILEEEKRETKWLEKGDILLGRVCGKMEGWGEDVSNAIDMMVQRDFKNELDQRKKFKEQREETGMYIELAIFGFLVEELAEDLVETSYYEVMF